MKTCEILNMTWRESEANPLITAPFPSWVIADPTFLPPDVTPDNQWHLFAHSVFGIQHYVSSDKMSWARKPTRIFKSCIRPFLYKEGKVFFLFYERILKFHLTKYISRIEVRSSINLMDWSDPDIVLEPNLTWQREGGLAGNAGNPCLVEKNGLYRLYYSAGLTYLKDCAFFEPKYIGCAISKSLKGPFIPLADPIISPRTDDPYSNLGAGAIKVIIADDGFIGFQNGIYWDAIRNHSGSAIRILTSSDGNVWERNGIPIIKPDRGWKKSHVYALDARFVENGLMLMFNARSGWLLGRECIGVAYGSISEEP